MAKKNLLLIFTRNPEPGKVKKRLASSVGDKAALDIYRFLLQHTFRITRNLEVEKVVYYSEGIGKDDLWEESSFKKRVQEGKGLGERMGNAFKRGFEEGFQNIIIIGSDLLDISQRDLEAAFEALEENPYVIGPALDGGYYLLGMKSLNSRLFRDKAWGTDSVLRETLKDLEKERFILLQERNDIDVLKDIDAHPELQQFIT